MADLIHGRTCVYNINYHIVWSTKRRKRVIVPDMEDDIALWAVEIGKRYGFEVKLIEAGNRDHIHCFVSCDQTMKVSRIIRLLKGCLARKCFQKYAFLDRAYPKHHMWNPSTYVETIGDISEETIRKYIERQDNSPDAGRTRG